MKKGCLVAICVSLVFCLCLWVLSEVLVDRPARLAVARIESANHEVLLVACRQMMANVSDFVDESTTPTEMRGVGVDIRGNSMQCLKKVPKAVRDLQPRWIWISSNEVALIFYGPPIRVNVHAFSVGTKGHGWKKLVDGLWLN